MDLICPHCQRRLTIEDRFAGTTVKCPQCNSMLQAPVLLAPPPLPPTPLSSPSPSMPLAAPVMPNLTLDSTSAVTEITAAPSKPVADRVPAPPGEYTQRYRWHLRADVLAWIPPGCLVLIFFLSFFAWYFDVETPFNLWELAFTQAGAAVYTFYTVVVFFLALPAAVITLILEKRWLPLPAGLQGVWPWRSLLVGGLIAVPFLMFFGDYVGCFFRILGNPATIAMKLAFRLHLLAVVACALQFWLELRRPRNLPLPRLEVRW